MGPTRGSGAGKSFAADGALHAMPSASCACSLHHTLQAVLAEVMSTAHCRTCTATLGTKTLNTIGEYQRRGSIRDTFRHTLLLVTQTLSCSLCRYIYDQGHLTFHNKMPAVRGLQTTGAKRRSMQMGHSKSLVGKVWVCSVFVCCLSAPFSYLAAFPLLLPVSPCWVASA